MEDSSCVQTFTFCRLKQCTYTHIEDLSVYKLAHCADTSSVPTNKRIVDSSNTPTITHIVDSCSVPTVTHFGDSVPTVR